MTQKRQTIIENALQHTLSPTYMKIENESYKHHVPKDSETHFNVTVVSPKFKSLALIARHKQINQLLAQEFDRGLHALSIHTYTPAEWDKRKNISPATPACRDGFNK